MQTICVLGLGYIGLPTASIFATNGLRVTGIDIDPNAVAMINKGMVHIQEPGLNILVRAAVHSGNLSAQTTPEPADVFIIAVPTPIHVDKTADMSCVISAAESLLPYLRPGNLVILESTSPPRTTVDLIAPILARSGLSVGREIFLAHCPERVLPGNILHELVSNSRIIGGWNHESALKARELYAKVVQGQIALTDATSAETAKLMENTFRDVNIALSNELAQVAYELRLDALEVIRLANLHPRVNLHQPGPGVGGHCLAVDPWFIVEKTSRAQLIRLSREINDGMPLFVAERVCARVAGQAKPKIAVLGVSYKGNVDDTRESPATTVIQALLARDCEVGVYDPHVRNYEYPLLSVGEAFRGADMALILADHEEFRYLAPEELGLLMRTRNVLDTKNCLKQCKWAAAGFEVELLGAAGDAKREE